MPRTARIAPPGLIYHVLNRGVGRQDLFEDEEDFAAFLRVFHDTLEMTPIRVLGFCLMSNHWHLVLWPKKAGELATFMQRLTITHVRRWTEQRRRVGWGSVYQGRYKSFAVQDDEHLATLLRYVERNPLRAGRVRRAERWRWSSLGQLGQPASDETPLIPIADWPVPRRRDWVGWVNRPQTAAEEAALQRCLKLSRPYGDATWTKATEKRLGLGEVRPPGRPKGWRKKK